MLTGAVRRKSSHCEGGVPPPKRLTQWREEQAKIRTRAERHERADQNYIEQGIRLLGSHSQAELAILLGFSLPGSTLDQDRIIPAFRPLLDIIHRIAQETKKAAPESEAACPPLLPLLDELRTYCYEHQVEEIPALLAV